MFNPQHEIDENTEDCDSPTSAPSQETRHPYPSTISSSSNAAHQFHPTLPVDSESRTPSVDDAIGNTNGPSLAHNVPHQGVSGGTHFVPYNQPQPHMTTGSGSGLSIPVIGFHPGGAHVLNLILVQYSIPIPLMTQGTGPNSVLNQLATLQRLASSTSQPRDLRTAGIAPTASIPQNLLFVQQAAQANMFASRPTESNRSIPEGGLPQANTHTYLSHMLDPIGMSRLLPPQPRHHTDSLAVAARPQHNDDNRQYQAEVPRATSASQSIPPSTVPNVSSVQRNSNGSVVHAYGSNEGASHTVGTSSGVGTGAHALPMILYCDSDLRFLSKYQCCLRQQIEIFEATMEDVQYSISRMKRYISQGQAGLRCRHCANCGESERAIGAVYYPGNLNMMYQAGQNMAKNHLCSGCIKIPNQTRQLLISLRGDKRRAAVGKEYWNRTAREMGIFEKANKGLWYRPPTTVS